MITVGSLNEFMVTRAHPDYEAYLVLLFASGLQALLPKKYAIKPYKIGESGWATVFSLDKTYVVLSQRSPQYTRKILEYLIGDELEATGLRIFRVAKAEKSQQYKIALKGTGVPLDLYRRIQYLKDTIPKYVYGKIYFIKYARNPVEYVKNALLPAPTDKILKVIHRKDVNQMEVYVDMAWVGIFMGKNGNNVASACKLTGFKVKIILD